MGEKQTLDEEFQQFAAVRWPKLLRTAYLLTGEQHAAEDLVQSSLERVYVAWRKVSAADDRDAYVRRVMVNAHARKHRKRLKEYLSAHDDTGIGPDLPERGDRSHRPTTGRRCCAHWSNCRRVSARRWSCATGRT